MTSISSRAVTALLLAAYRRQTCLLRNIAGAIAALVGLPLFALILVNLHGQRQPASQRPAASTRVAGFPVPYWRELLSARWQTELTAVTELSLAFHETAEVAAAGASPASLRRLQRRTVAARRALADLEEALARLSAGHYGRCEQCGGGIPADWLLRQPEVRYCPGCLPGAPAAVTVTMSAAFRNLLALVLAPALNRLSRRGGPDSLPRRRPRRASRGRLRLAPPASSQDEEPG